MKKNRTMRAATLLLALTLITSTFVSGTFAKYVATASGTDTARVAHWGVTVTASGNEAFAKQYNNGDAVAETEAGTGEEGSTATESAAVDVKSDVKVVAPGTGGDLFSATITSGTPEVDAKIIASANLDLSGWSYEVEAEAQPDDGQDDATTQADEPAGDGDGDQNTAQPTVVEYCPLVFEVSGKKIPDEEPKWCNT